MTPESLAFYGVSIVLTGSALAVVLSRNLFHAVLWLALTLTGTAGVFPLWDAEFLAAVQLLYRRRHHHDRRLRHRGHRATGRGAPPSDQSPRRGRRCRVSLALLGLVLRSSAARRHGAGAGRPDEGIGENVLSEFVVPFELLAVLMLAALVGAIYFARPGRLARWGCRRI